jgi:hypothetical protein
MSEALMSLHCSRWRQCALGKYDDLIVVVRGIDDLRSTGYQSRVPAFPSILQISVPVDFTKQRDYPQIFQAQSSVSACITDQRTCAFCGGSLYPCILRISVTAISADLCIRNFNESAYPCVFYGYQTISIQRV